jgi:hypothetical protein
MYLPVVGYMRFLKFHRRHYHKFCFLSLYLIPLVIEDFADDDTLLPYCLTITQSNKGIRLGVSWCQYVTKVNKVFSPLLILFSWQCLAGKETSSPLQSYFTLLYLSSRCFSLSNLLLCRSVNISINEHFSLCTIGFASCTKE